MSNVAGDRLATIGSAKAESVSQWENDDIAPGTRNCPDCGTFLDSYGWGGNCGGYHESECDTCEMGHCDGSC